LQIAGETLSAGDHPFSRRAAACMLAGGATGPLLAVLQAAAGGEERALAAELLQRIWVAQTASAVEQAYEA
jgi:hypothetical protein